MIGNKLEPFKFWCQKVLPNVYDDSLSYYEYLCKMNDYLNNVIEQINTLTDEMESYEGDLNGQWDSYKTNLNNEWIAYKNELNAQWAYYKNYIDHYFDNLDVQVEINNKLDQMATDGTLDALLLPYFNAYKTEINQIVATQNQKIAEHSADIENLDSRIDGIASLPEGSTTGDAELIDIRTPYTNFNNNENYTNAGSSVRGQVGTLAEFADGIFKANDESVVWENKVLDADGNLVNNTDWRTTTISVKNCPYVRIQGLFNILNPLSYEHIGFFSGKTPSSNNLISYVNFTDGANANVYRYLKTPVNTQSIVICTRDTSVSSVKIRLAKETLVFNKISDTYINSSAITNEGKIKELSGWKSCDYIYVKHNTKIMFDYDLPNITMESWCGIAFFDEFGNVIERYNGTKCIYDIPSNATYCRYTLNDASLIDGHYLLNENAMFPDIELRPNDINILENYEDFSITKNGITMAKYGSHFDITGTAEYLNATCQVLPIGGIVKGHTYKIHYTSVATNVYLQYGANGTPTTTLERSTYLTIGNDAIDPMIRLLINTVESTTYDIDLEVSFIDVTETDINEVHVSTSAELYNFLYNFPTNDKYTKLYLDAKNYDLYTGLYQTYISNDEMHFNMNDHYLHNVEIIGNGAIISLKVPEADTINHNSSVNTVSAFNVRGNVYIHDLTVDAENCRYAIHDESQSDIDIYFTEHKYENILLKYNRTSGSVNLVMCCIGIGGSKGQKYIFKNCTFNRTGVTGLGGAFYIHGRGYNIESIEMNGCVFTSTGNADRLFVLSQYTGNDFPTNVTLNNCVVSGQITIRPQTDSGFTKQQWAVRLVNTYHTQIVIEQGTTYPLVSEPVVINSLTGVIS